MTAGETIPAELREHRRWLVWKSIPRPGRKPTKQPRRPAAPDVALSIHDTHHLVDYQEAQAIVDAGNADGIGFAMRPEDGLVFVDLDGCVQDGVPEAWAAEIVFRLGGYAEFSPSGTGLHVLVRGTLPAAGLTNHPQGVEVYASGRYFTVTGQQYAGDGLPDAQEALDWLVQTHLAGGRAEQVTDAPELCRDPEADVLDLDQLEQLGLSHAHRLLIETGETFEEFYPDGERDHSRAVWDVCAAMARLGVNAETMLDVLSDPQNYLAAEGALRRRGGDVLSAQEWLWRYQVHPALQTHQAALEAEKLALAFTRPEPPAGAQGLPGVTQGVDIGDNADQLAPEPWILGRRFRLGAVTLGHGDPGCGKSYLSILSALSVITGQALTGEEVVETGNVWILNNEDSLADMRKRIHAVARFHGLNLQLVRAHLRISSGLDQGKLCVAELKSEKDAAGNRVERVQPTQQAAEMVEFIKANAIRHLVLDPLVQLHQLDENSNAHLNAVLGILANIANRGGCSIDLLHHNVKGGEDPEAGAGRLSAARGASAISGAVRAQYSVCRMGRTSGELYGVPEADWPRYVRVQMSKNNYGPTGGAPTWFYMEQLALDNAAPPRPADVMAVPVLRPLTQEAEARADLAESQAMQEALGRETAVLNALAEHLKEVGSCRVSVAAIAVSAQLGRKVSADEIRALLKGRQDAMLGTDQVEIQHTWNANSPGGDTVEITPLAGAA